MAWVLFAQQNTIKTAIHNSIINFYFVTVFYSLVRYLHSLRFDSLILNLEVIEQHLEMVLRCQACVCQIAGDMVPFM